jgi:hypothetical protein
MLAQVAEHRHIRVQRLLSRERLVKKKLDHGAAPRFFVIERVDESIIFDYWVNRILTLGSGNRDFCASIDQWQRRDAMNV